MQAGPCRTVEEEQEKTSRNHVRTGQENGFLLPPISMTRNAMEIGINQGFTLNPGLFVGRINLKSHENITSKDLRVTVSIGIGVSHVERDTYCLNMGRISVLIVQRFSKWYVHCRFSC